jgi:hypothetical protein
MSLITDMAVHARKCTSIKGNNVAKSVRHHSSDLYMKAIVIKHAEQANNCEAARIYSCFLRHISEGRNEKPELMPI